MPSFVYAKKTYSNTAVHYEATYSTLNSIYISCGILCVVGYDHCLSFSVRQLWICNNNMQYLPWIM